METSKKLFPIEVEKQVMQEIADNFIQQEKCELGRASKFTTTLSKEAVEFLKKQVQEENGLTMCIAIYYTLVMFSRVSTINFTSSLTIKEEKNGNYWCEAEARIGFKK